MSTTWHDAAAHGLPHDPLKAIVAPRPIGWISTYADDGTANLAPYSFFNLVSDSPKIVMFASTGDTPWKHSAANAVRRGGFAANLATLADLSAVSATSAALGAGESEFSAAGLVPERCRGVDAPRIAGHAAALECVVTQHMTPRTREGGEADAVLVFGEVVGYHIDERLMVDGRFDSASAALLARLGYRDYAAVESTFELARPNDATKGLSGT